MVKAALTVSVHALSVMIAVHGRHGDGCCICNGQDFSGCVRNGSCCDNSSGCCIGGCRHQYGKYSGRHRNWLLWSGPGDQRLTGY